MSLLSYRDFFLFTLTVSGSTLIRICGLGRLTIPVFTDGADIRVLAGGLERGTRATLSFTPISVAGLLLLTIPSFTVGVGDVSARLRGATRLFLVGAKGILFFLLFAFVLGVFGVGYVLGMLINGVRQ
jgi:hypothetical protein